MNRKTIIFACPMCGNEMKKSDRDWERCPWCKTRIIPQGKTIQREAGIYDEKNKTGERRKEAQR